MVVALVFGGGEWVLRSGGVVWGRGWLSVVWLLGKLEVVVRWAVCVYVFVCVFVCVYLSFQRVHKQ